MGHHFSCYLRDMLLCLLIAITPVFAESYYFPPVALDATLQSLAAYNTNGIICQTAADTFAGRTITGTSNRISVSNGSGVSGNPTIDIDAAYVGQNTITTVGTIGTGTWNGTAIGPTKGGTGLTAVPTANYVLGADAAGTAIEGKSVVSGDTDRVTVTHGVGSITISGPQDLNTTSVPTFAGSIMSDSGGKLLESYYKIVSVSSAEILTLNSSPKRLIDAPGANKMIIVRFMQLDYDYNSIAYASGGNLGAVYGATSGNNATGTTSSAFLQNTSDRILGLTGPQTATASFARTAVVNQPVDLFSTTLDYTTGNGTLKVYIQYNIVDLSP